MKLNVTRILCRVGLVSSFTLFLSIVALAAGGPDFVFKNGVRIAGTDLQVGAVYKYTNVKPGVDCRVTITAISTGVQVLEIDGGSGYNDALQPTLRVAPHKKGHLEMSFQFYVGGTLLPYIAAALNVTPIDVDGLLNADGANHPLYEFDEININGGYVNFDGDGGELVISHTGNWFIGRNVGGIDYPARDTSARQVMFTVSNVLVSNFIIRVGVDNQSNNSADRLRSVYFKRFTYNNSPLAAQQLTSFNGTMGDKKINLNWTLAEINNIGTVELERSYNAKEFSTIANYWLDVEESKQRSFAFADNKPAAGIAYYRLKMIAAGGKTTYSNVLCLRETTNGIASLKVYPTETTNNVTVNLATASAGKAVVLVTDLSGKVMKQQTISLQKGVNTTTLSGFESMMKGTYVVAVRYDNKLLSELVLVR
jgi:hypothetical protein